MALEARMCSHGARGQDVLTWSERPGCVHMELEARMC